MGLKGLSDSEGMKLHYTYCAVYIVTGVRVLNTIQNHSITVARILLINIACFSPINN